MAASLKDNVWYAYPLSMVRAETHPVRQIGSFMNVFFEIEMRSSGIWIFRTSDYYYNKAYYVNLIAFWSRKTFSY